MRVQWAKNLVKLAEPEKFHKRELFYIILKDNKKVKGNNQYSIEKKAFYATSMKEAMTQFELIMRGHIK